MEQILQRTLRDDERVLWFGRPNQSQLLKSPDKNLQIIYWFLAAAMALFSFGWFLPYALGADKGLGVTMVAMIFLNFVPIALAVRPAMDKKILEKKTIYAVTDQRVIAVVKDNVLCIPRENLSYSVEAREGNVGNLCFNSAIGQPVQKSRANAVLGFVKSSGAVHGLLFFRISDPDSVMNALAVA